MPSKHKIWAQLPPLPKDQLVSQVQKYESAGLEGIWSSQTFGAPFVPLAAAAAVSTKLKLGTGIALAFVRSPLDTATMALDVDTISGGRLVLGLGSSAKMLIDAFGMEYGKPLKHMREVIGLIRQIVAKGHTGELGLLEGEYHTLDLRHFRTLAPPTRTEIPIFMPAVFEKACQMAGELANGLLGHPLWSDKWIKEQVFANVDTGLKQTGRNRSEIDINLNVFVAVNKDKREAINDARANIAYYSQSEQYHRYFEYIGFGKEAKAIQDAFTRNDFTAMSAACSDEMVEAIALVGPADEVRRRMSERAELADSITPVIPHFGLTPEKAAFYLDGIADCFYGN
ncbi:MAG: oxidoreductase [Verrucomicrobiaceae bacterium]|nr:oxidoreductase [Verrucomicrobiaceae bacterium]